jgi:hypothetical protein
MIVYSCHLIYIYIYIYQINRQSKVYKLYNEKNIKIIIMMFIFYIYHFILNFLYFNLHSLVFRFAHHTHIFIITTHLLFFEGNMVPKNICNDVTSLFEYRFVGGC